MTKHKENHSHEGVFICDETHVQYHKIFVSNSSAKTTSFRHFLKQTDKISIKWIVF